MGRQGAPAPHPTPTGSHAPDCTGREQPPEAQNRGEPGSCSCRATGIGTDTGRPPGAMEGSRGCSGEGKTRPSLPKPRVWRQRKRMPLGGDANTVTLKGTAGHVRPCICVPATPLSLPETDPMATAGTGDACPRRSEGAAWDPDLPGNPSPNPSGHAGSAAVASDERLLIGLFFKPRGSRPFS